MFDGCWHQSELLNWKIALIKSKVHNCEDFYKLPPAICVTYSVIQSSIVLLQPKLKGFKQTDTIQSASFNKYIPGLTQYFLQWAHVQLQSTPTWRRLPTSSSSDTSFGFSVSSKSYLVLFQKYISRALFTVYLFI